MAGGGLLLPGVLQGGRRAAFVVLCLLAAGEASAHVAMSAGLRTLLQGAAPGGAVWLGFASLAAGGLFWARGVAAERFGQAYVQALRQVLSRQAVRASQRRMRLGAVSVRMTSDLNAMKDWADKGLCGVAVGLFGLCGALGAAWVAAGLPGLLAALVGPLLALLTALLLARPLVRAVRARRKARGRLSAVTGDLAVAARAYGAYGAEHRAAAKVARAGARLAAASVAEARLHQALLLPALLGVPLGIAGLAWLAAPGAAGAGWAGLLFALSLCAAAISTLTRAFLAGAERGVALARLRGLLREAAAAPQAAPQGRVRLPPGPGVGLVVDGAEIAAAGAIRSLTPEELAPWRERLRSGGEGVEIDGRAAPQFAAVDWARRVALCAPDLPLPRGRLAQALAAKRHPSPERAGAALRRAGLDAASPLLSGTLEFPPSAIEARLRLARALAHRPRLLLIDDPWIVQDAVLLQRLRKWAAGRQLTLLWVSSTLGAGEGVDAPA